MILSMYAKRKTRCAHLVFLCTYDSHHPLQVGSVWTSIDGSYTKVLDIKEKMKLGNLEIGIANNIEEKISKAREIKKSLCGKA